MNITKKLKIIKDAGIFKIDDLIRLSIIADNPGLSSERLLPLMDDLSCRKSVENWAYNMQEAKLANCEQKEIVDGIRLTWHLTEMGHGLLKMLNKGLGPNDKGKMEEVVKICSMFYGVPVSEIVAKGTTSNNGAKVRSVAMLICYESLDISRADIANAFARTAATVSYSVNGLLRRCSKNKDVAKEVVEVVKMCDHLKN